MKPSILNREVVNPLIEDAKKQKPRPLSIARKEIDDVELKYFRTKKDQYVRLDGNRYRITYIDKALRWLLY